MRTLHKLSYTKKYFVFLLGIKIVLSTQVFAQPIITSFSPASGAVGTTVTITGANFDPNPANNIVYFGSVKATISSANSTSIIVKVPTGASYQPITVTVNALIAASSFPFTLIYSGGGAINSTTYETKKSFSTGNFPQVVLAGDFDGDGKPDMVTPNTNSNTISVLKNTSTSGIVSFAAKVDYPAAGSPANVSIADFDGDGKLDLAVVNISSNIVSFYRNTSTNTISFAAKIDFTTGASPYGIAIADFNGDGKQDIAVANYASNTVSVLKNNSSPGNISFGVKSDFTIGAGPFTITSGDVDGDNKADLVSTNSQSNSISILRNISDVNGISFASRIDIGTIASPATATIADFDNDGKQDIAVGSETVATVSIYRNLSGVGNISLSSKVDYSIAGPSYYVAAGDLNGDGKPDIVSGFISSNIISVIENTSTPGILSFSQKINYTSDSGPFYTIVQDVDGDGVNDFVSANSNSNSISVFRNNLNASLVPTISSFTPTSATSGTIVTINGSNFNGATAVNLGGVAASSFTITSSNTIQAVVSTGASGDVSVTTVTGTATLPGFTYFTPVVITTPVITTFTPQSGPIAATVIITGINFSPLASNDIVYFGAVKANVINASSTSLTVTVPSGTTYEPITVTSNGFTGYWNKPFNVTFPGATGTFLPEAFSNRIDSITNNNDSYGISISDLDGDGKPDLITANYQNGTISIIKNASSTGKIQLESKMDFISGSNSNRVKTADLDGDGKPDILVTSFSSNYVSIYRNTSSNNNITFADKIDFATELGPEDVSVGDIDGDGRPDMVVVNGNSHTVSIFRNTSTSPGIISFAPYVNFLPSTHPFRVSIADMDNDGKPDLVIANAGASSNSISILRNLSTIGAISFAIKVDYPAGTRPYGQAVGDLDGDGKPDVVVINNGSSTLSIFKNVSTNGIISLSLKIDLPTGTFPQDISIADLDGDGKPDIAVTNNINNTSSVSVYKNVSSNGTLSFLQSVNYASTNARGIASADFDGDGKPDIATANYNSVSIFRFKIPAPSITSFTPVKGNTGTVVTIKGTNFLDATLVTFGGMAVSYTVDSINQITAIVGTVIPGIVSITVTTPAGTTSTAGFYTGVTITSFSPVAGHIGSLVTITGTNFSNIPSENIVFFGAVKAEVSSATTSTLIVKIPAGATFENISVTTNNLTAYSSQPFVTTFSGDTTGFKSNSFSSKIDYTTAYPQDVSLGDLDGDGKPDLVAVNFVSNTISIFKNKSTTGNLLFDNNVNYSTGPAPLVILVKDLDNDGKPDIVVTNEQSNTISVFKNTSSNGSLSFSNKIDFATGISPERIAASDINGDGKIDLAVLNFGSATVSIFINTSTSNSLSFAPKLDFYGVQSLPKSLGINDFDGDGKPDLAVTDIQGKVIVLRNTSTSEVVSFASSVEFISGTISISIGDLDGDGKADIVDVNRGNNSVSVLRNVSTPGNILFNTTVDYPIGGAVSNVCMGDLNGDGKPELIVTNNNFVSVLRNTTSIGNISFDSKVDYFTATQPEIVRTGDLDGDGKAEIIFVNPGPNTISILKNQVGPLATITTTTSVTSSLNPSTFGQSVTFTAIVTTASGTPIGTVSFYDGTSLLGTGTISNSNANYTSSLLATGLHSITAKYDGNSNYATSTSSTLTQVVTNNQPPLAIITYTGSTTFCDSGSLLLNANTGTGLSYQWYKNAVIINGAISSTYIANATGNYTVVVSNGSASATSNTVSITINSVPTITSQGDTMLISSTSSYYQWFFNNIVLAGETSNKLRIKNIGFYRVETSLDKSCWSASLDFPILILPPRLLPDTLSMEIYPNPAVNFFNVVVRLQRVTTVTAFVTVSNASGNVILQTNKLIFYGNEIKIPITLNATGTFFVKVNINGNVKTLSVILQ
jgi:6-phosphogluconolactonase (cycloisomerase 2 family)